MRGKNKMEHIAVSVIVPIYNAEPWLEECVQSILDQDFPASYGTIEVLLIDDGATDGSGALCDRLAKRDNRIKVVHQENQGLSGARNTEESAVRTMALITMPCAVGLAVLAEPIIRLLFVCQDHAHDGSASFSFFYGCGPLGPWIQNAIRSPVRCSVLP